MAAVTDTDVLIVGGGPVGLYLACLFARNNVDFRLVESRTEPSQHSRSIGIHPPALELMDEIDVSEELIQHGIPVEEGVAFGNRRKLGRMSFRRCPGPYRFILAIPQNRTESILLKQLETTSSSCLMLGDSVIDLHEFDDHVCLTLDSGKRLSAKIVVGADGWNSTVRHLAGIGHISVSYPDTYVMGDYVDTTDLGPVASIFLHRRGLIESFPLPGGIRRWVAKTPEFVEHPTHELLETMVRERTTFRLPQRDPLMISSFRTYSARAEEMARGRVVLTGDAAHVVSPIGGQGMNLGWLGASDAAKMIETVLRYPDSLESAFAHYHERRMRALRTATGRAEFNMWMGRSQRVMLLKHTLTTLALRTPLHGYFARRFSMRGIL